MTEETPRDTSYGSEAGPTAGPVPDPPTLPDAKSLAARLRERFGPDVDPGISLEPEGETAAPSDFSSEVLRRLASRPDASSRYRLQGEVAQGGMGAILRIWDQDLRRHLAMKVMLGRVPPADAAPAHPTETRQAETPPIPARSIGRFLEEAQVTGQLDHPGILPVHELGLDRNGRVYFTKKIVKGEDLKYVFARVHAD
jgi:serine/threonine protein kinase